LLLIFALTITGAVALVTGAVSVLARRAFENADLDRRQALLEQFQKRLDEQGAEVVRRLERVAASRELLRIAIEAAQPEPDLAQFVNDAQTQAEAASLDYLDILRADGAIISSAHWPAKFNYKNDWTVALEDRLAPEAFLSSIPTPEGGSALALISIRRVKGGDRVIEVIGGKRLDADFLASLGLAPGMRAALLDPKGKMDASLQPLVARVAKSLQKAGETIGADAVLAMPLERRGTLMAVLVVSTSLQAELSLESRILRIGLLASFAGIVLGMLMGWWATERVTRPVTRLADGARAVAAGNWESRVDVSSPDEIGELAAAFNRMTEQLIEQRERAIQAERVAAWRELARRLAHELKNPLFPLQITVENLRRARELSAPGESVEFEEVFQESTQMLLAELGKLKTIIGRFSDFAKMPPPELEQVDVNQIVREAMKLFDAQSKKIEVEMDLYPAELRIHADPEQLGRALRNLALNSMDAMPEGGRLTLRTRPGAAGVRIEVSDTGAGLTEEECSRLFTPYYTTKQHGTGLGLAIVQSVVSDHHGRIWVESTPGSGATFMMDLPT
jgi:signal transduction histidine kinase